MNVTTLQRISTSEQKPCDSEVPYILRGHGIIRKHFYRKKKTAILLIYANGVRKKDSATINLSHLKANSQICSLLLGNCQKSPELRIVLHKCLIHLRRSEIHNTFIYSFKAYLLLFCVYECFACIHFCAACG